MTSSIINFIAEKYLANIVEINPEQTKASLWSGTFEMNNLKMKKEIFQSLNLPYFELVNGYVGRLKIVLSLPRFYLNPIKVEVDKVFFHARHKSLDTLNKEEEQRSMEKYKNAKLLSAEQFTSEVNRIEDESASTSSSSTAPSYITTIINNVQITINDICFRFEDSISSHATPFALGVILKKVIIQTTHSNYELSDNPEQIPFAEVNHKLIKLCHLSIFLDTYTDISHMDYAKDIIDSDETIIDNDLKNYLGQSCSFYRYGLTETLSKFKDNTAHSYLLYDLVMNLQVALNENLTNGQPKLKAECLFNDIQILISLDQIKVLMQLLAYMNLNSLYELGIRKSYYTKSLAQEEKYAYMNYYIEYYTMKYNNSSGDDVKEKEAEVNRLKVILDQTEERLTYEKIQSMRDACLIKIKYIHSINEIDKEISDLEKGTWNPLTYLMTSKTEKEAQMKELKSRRKELSLQADDIENKLKKKLETPLLQKATTINENDTIKMLKDSFILYHIKLSLTEIKLTLLEVINSQLKLNQKKKEKQTLKQYQPLLVIRQKRLEVLGHIRKGGQFFSLYIGDIIISQEKLRNILYHNLLETIDSIDKYYEKDNEDNGNDDNDINDADSNATVPLYKKVPIKPSNTNSNGALYVEFENCPNLPFSNYRLKFRNDKQLLITFNVFSSTYSMTQVLNALNTTISLDDIQKYTAGEVTKYVQEGYIENLLSGNYQHFNIDLDIILNGPIVLIPQNILDINNRKCIMIKLGDLNIKSKLPPKQNLKEIDYIHFNDPRSLYDVYIFEASNFTLSTLTKFDGDIGHIGKAVKYDIIEDISIGITFSNIIEPKNVHLPKIDLVISINSIEVNLRDVQCYFFIEFIDGYEKTNEYLQLQLKMIEQNKQGDSNPLSLNQHHQIGDDINLNLNVNANEELIVKYILNTNNDNSSIDNIPNERETLFLKMSLKLHSIRFLIQKTITNEEHKQFNHIEPKGAQSEPFKHFVSFGIKQLAIKLSITEKKNTNLFLSLFTICITDEETKYDSDTNQIKLISNPAFISLLSTHNTNVTDILQNDRRGMSLLMSLRNLSMMHQPLIDNNEHSPFTLITYAYDSSKGLSTVSVKMSDIKMNLNLSTLLRLYQFLVYFYEEYNKMWSKHIEEETNSNSNSNSNSLSKEYNQFKQINQLGNKMLPKESINNDFIFRLRRTIRKDNSNSINDGLSDKSKANKMINELPIKMANSIQVNAYDETTMTKEKGMMHIVVTLALTGVEFIFPVTPEESNTKLLKFNLNFISKVELHTEYESIYSIPSNANAKVNSNLNNANPTLIKTLTRVNYSKRNIKFNAKLYQITFDIISYVNDKFRSNCLSEKILNNLRIILECKAFLLLPEEKSITTINTSIEPMAIMLGFREVKVFNKLLSQIELFNKSMSEPYTDPIKANDNDEDQGSIFFTNCKINTGLKNLLKDKTKIIKLKAIKTILQEEAKQISNKINQVAKVNITSFNDLLDITFNLHRVTLRVIDNTQNYEASIFHIELNQLNLHYISNSEPNDVPNMANAIVEAIGGNEIPFDQFNWYKLALFFEASVQFALSFYNDRVNNWEPIIEPWGLTLKTIQVAKFTRLKSELTSDSMLNCNVSLNAAIVFNSFMTKLNQSEDDWFQESKNASFNTEKGDDSAVEFCNISGLDLTFWFESLSEEKYILKDNDKKVFTKNDMIKVNSNGNGNSNKLMMVDMESQLGRSTNKFAFRLKGYSVIVNQDYFYSHFNNYIIDCDNKKDDIFNDIDEDDNCNEGLKKKIQLTLRIKSRGMVKSILFESNVSLFNKLIYPIMIVFVKESDYIGKYEGNDDLIDYNKEINKVIYPNKKSVIPLNYIREEYRVYIGIEQNSQGNKLQLLLSDFDFLNEYNDEMASYYNAPRDSKPIIRDKVSKVLEIPYKNRMHYISVDLLVQKAKSDKIQWFKEKKSKDNEEDEDMNKDNNKEKDIDKEDKVLSIHKTFSYYLVLQDPLVLENQLPFPIKLSINNSSSDINSNSNCNCNGNDTFIRNLDLKPLDIIPMHSLDPSDTDSQVTISINYHNSLYQSAKFFLFDKSKDKKRLIPLKRTSDSQCIHLSIDIGKNDIDSNMYNSNRLDLIKVFSHRMKLVFYSEYIVVNKTLLTLYGKDSSHSDTKAALPSVNGSFYPLSVNLFNLTIDKISIRDGTTDWCKPFELKTFGIAGVCTLKNKRGKYEHMLELAVLISASEKFTYSTILTLEDRYLIMNELGIAVYFRQYTDKRMNHSPMTLDSSDRRPVSFSKTSKKMKKCLQVALTSSSQSQSNAYSSPFYIDDLDDVNIKIPLDDKTEQIMQNNEEVNKNIFALNGKKYLLVKVTIHSIDNGIIYIILHYPQYPDFKINNTTIDSTVQIYQKNDDFNKEYFDMHPNDVIPFVWDDLLKEDRILVCIIKSKAIEISFDKIEVLAYDINGKRYYIDISLENDNMTRVLSIKEVLASKEETTAMKILLGKKKAINSKLHVKLNGIGLSVIDDYPKEVLYLSISGIDVRYCKHINKSNKTIENTDTVIISLMNMQIDYCLSDNSFKSLLMPKRVVNNEDFAYAYMSPYAKPFIQIIQSRRVLYNIECDKSTTTYPQSNILMQDVNLYLDQKSLMSLFQLWKELLGKIDFYQPKKNYVRIQSFVNPNEDDQYQYNGDLAIGQYDSLLNTNTETAESIINKTHYNNMLFINSFTINALKVIVSLRIDLREFGTDFGLPRWLFKIVVSIGNSLGHITNAPITFRKVISKNVFTDWSRIIDLLMKTYQGQIFEQIYTIIGYSNLLGNPLGRMEKFSSNSKESKSKGLLKKSIEMPMPMETHRPIEHQDNNAIVEQIRKLQTSLIDTSNGNSNKPNNEPNGNNINEDQPLKLQSNKVVIIGEEIDDEQGFASKAKVSLNKGQDLRSSVHFKSQKPHQVQMHMPLGIRDQTKGVSKENEGVTSHLLQFRYPRIIDSVKGLQPYDPSRAEIYAILKRNWDDYDEEHKIVYFRDMIYLEDDYLSHLSTLILTESHILIVYNANKIVFNSQLRKVIGIEVHLVNELYVFVFKMKNNKNKCFKTNDLILCCELYSILSKMIQNDLK